MADQYEIIKNGATENYYGFEELRQLILAELQRRSKGTGTSSIIKQVDNNYTFNEGVLQKYQDKYNHANTELSERQFEQINFENALNTINAIANLMIVNAPNEKKRYDIIPALSSFYTIVNDWRVCVDSPKNLENPDAPYHGCNAACSGLCTGNGMELTDGEPLPGIDHSAPGDSCAHCGYVCSNACDDTCNSNCYGAGSYDPNSCSAGCSALCQAGCRNGCHSGCTSCSSCHGNCSSECESNCSTYCGSKCSGGCFGSCGNNCGTNVCQSSCGQACFGTCQYSSTSSN